MLETSLTPQLFAILTHLVEERVGLCYSPEEKDIFAMKITGRALEAGFESLLDYYYYLRYDAASGAEFDALVDALVVNETFFFRELEPLRILVADKLAAAVESTGRARVWCAACSTGEEPLTLAMLLAERGILDKVEIVASDVCTRVLGRAQTGRYGPSTLRRVPTPAFARPFIQADESGGTVAADLVRAITWKQLNLMDSAAIASQGAMDVILCRNVLIYFRDQVTQRVVRSLADRLAPGGILCVGVSESLIRFDTSLVCEERGGAFFYRKPEQP
jgi:chemotaxis protein methyltransferase CheR